MIETTINDIVLRFETNNEVFSPKQADTGTLAMLSLAKFTEEDKILDLGCGYGLVGIYAATLLTPAQVTMCDISENAVQLSQINATLNHVSEGLTLVVSDALNNLEGNDFTLILSNPPYHVDFKVPKTFIEQGYKKLCLGGRFMMVTKRKDWYKNKLISVFGGVSIVEKDGYFIFTAQKRARTFSKPNEAAKPQLSKKLARKLHRKNS